ncbi:hypothetical protein [Methylobacterium sp. WCS2018Hpa-22]|uniref:hypothetical protein n=1 Tax=Methylobacterium sp. WCS2018Hpa-22 TaxID=3073633 RepID=UPI002889C098|nr:hypothetical protein [Methylobacterium sp. WCS2018Hpa-22]
MNDRATGRVLIAGGGINLPANAVQAVGQLGLGDALTLSALLAERTDWGTVGPPYEALRRPRVAHVQAMTDRLSRTARMPGRKPPASRDRPAQLPRDLLAAPHAGLGLSLAAAIARPLRGRGSRPWCRAGRSGP